MMISAKSLIVNLLISAAIVSTISMVGLLLISAFFNVPIGLFPTAAGIGRTYLEAIVAGDIQQIARMAKDDDNRGCVRSEARANIAKYGNASIRNVTVSTKPGDGSDDRLEWTIVKFDYRRLPSLAWQAGEIVIMTNNRYNSSLFRSLNCIGG